MSNRIYLYCTDFSEMPTARREEDFFKACGVEYEAKACIPIFWMCLFSTREIKIVPANHDGFEDDSWPYGYLLTARAEALERLRIRAPMMAKALGQERFALYLEWVARLESESGGNILVRTAELDWMEHEGALEKMLKKAFTHFEQVDAQGEMRMSNAMKDLAGLWNHEGLDDCESFELVGTANSKPSWPTRFAPYVAPAESPPKRPWWKLWRSHSEWSAS